jgi:hypothetical protein
VSGELAELVNDVWPYVTAAVGAYGTAVLQKGEDAAAEASVGLGRRILQRVFGHGTDTAPEALTDLVEAPGDEDLQAALRVRLRKALAADEELVNQVRALLAEAPGSGVVVGDGSQAVVGSQISGDNIQIGSAGGDVTIRRG